MHKDYGNQQRNSGNSNRQSGKNVNNGQQAKSENQCKLKNPEER